MITSGKLHIELHMNKINYSLELATPPPHHLNSNHFLHQHRSQKMLI